MKDFIQLIRQRAKENFKTIVLPEGNEERVVQAASILANEKIADIVLLGRAGDILRMAKQKGCDISSVKIIDHSISTDYLNEFTDIFYNLRKHKGITPDEARRTLIDDPVYFAAMMAHKNLADGFVAGASHTTKDVAKAALYCIGLDKEMTTMSSCFIMILDDRTFGEDGIFIFADCGIIPDPSAKQLANITISSSRLMERIIGSKPRVAMLSYSTKGSAQGPLIDKVREATALVKQTLPDLLIDGELQVDAAIVPQVATIKAPDSPLKGRANILIFPNLDAGNIGYKLVNRLAKAKALGPMILGLAKPASDLSRGCSVDEIVDVVAITAARC